MKDEGDPFTTGGIEFACIGAVIDCLPFRLRACSIAVGAELSDLFLDNAGFSTSFSARDAAEGLLYFLNTKLCGPSSYQPSRWHAARNLSAST